MTFTVPSPDSTAFSCPYCGAYASQTWFQTFAQSITSERRRPYLPVSRSEVSITSELKQDTIRMIYEWTDKIVAKEIFLEQERESKYVQEVNNVNLSQCFNCKNISLWHHRSLVYPRMRAGASPNPDMDQDIKDDIDEARAILDISPRGAAALLRLALQKLCRQLGEPGKKIDVDIQSLVNKGMDPHLQQAFDTVRVIGNEAVHPGKLDLKDDHSTAIMLIDLINIVAQQMITNKKAIAAIYSRLPSDKLKGIDDRAKGAARKSQGTDQ